MQQGSSGVRFHGVVNACSGEDFWSSVKAAVFGCSRTACQGFRRFGKAEFQHCPQEANGAAHSMIDEPLALF